MSEDKKSSGVIGVGLGAAAAGTAGYAVTKGVGHSAITEIITDTAPAAEGAKAAFADAVKKAGAAPLKEGVTQTASAALKDAQAIIKPAEGATKATSEAIKAAKATRSEAINTIRTGLKADKVSVLKNIKGTHLAGIAVGALAVGYATKKVSDGLFGSKASRIEAERGTEAAAGRT